MDFKYPKTKVLLLLVVFSFALALLLKNADAEETWKLMGKTKDMNFLVYYATSSISYTTETLVSMRLKKERSQEGIEQFKKEFNASLKEAEARAGERLRDDPRPLLNILIKRETKEYKIEIDCTRNELRLPPEKMSGFNMVIVDAIEPGTAIENIRNEVCKKPSPDKKQ